MTNKEKRKILNEIGSLFKSLEIQINDLKNGKNLFYILLNDFLIENKKIESVEDIEDVLDEIEMDRRDFLGTLYEMELRIRTLKDLLNENELI
jgi:hypothetical protein